MPQLKQLSCCVQWADTNAPFPEYDVHYGDGVVESVIIVPNHPQPFCIRLTSHGFVYEGLSMVVYVDGRYQCNRSRVSLKVPTKGKDSKLAEIDFLVRQQETSFGDGAYIGREWRFDNHNIVDRTASDAECEHFDQLGTIEVLVLRCRATLATDGDYEGSSSGADTHISDLGEERRPDLDAKGSGDASKAATVEPEEEVMAFGLNIFDGANDPPPYDGAAGGQGRYIWQQTHAPSTQDFTNVHNMANPQASQTHFGQALHGHDNFQHAFPYPPQSIPHHAPHVPHAGNQTSFSHHPTHPHPHPQYTGHPPPKHVHFEQHNPPPQPPFAQQGHQPGYMHPPPQTAPAPAQPGVHSPMTGQHGTPYSQNASYPLQQFHNQPNYEQARSSVSSFQRQVQDFAHHGNDQQNWSANNHQGENNGQMQNSTFQRSRSTNGQGNPQNNQNNDFHQNNTGQRMNSSGQQGTQNSSSNQNQNQNGNQNAPNDWKQQSSNNDQQRRSTQQSQQNRPQQRQNSSAQHGNMFTAQHNAQQPMHQAMYDQQYLHPSQYPYSQAYPGQWYPNAQYMNMMSNWPMPPYSMYPSPDPRANGGRGSFNSAISPKTGCANCAAPIPNNQANSDNQATGDDGNWNNDNNNNSGDANETNGNEWNNNDNTNGNVNDNQADDSWANSNNNINNDTTNNNDWENNAASGGDQGWDQNNDSKPAEENWETGNNSGGNDTSWENNNADASGNNSGSKSEDVQDCARNLYGPNGIYVRMSQPSEDEPAPVEPEEPSRYDVPANVAQEFGSTKQVQPGPGYRYYKKRLIPEYIDTLMQPYARFVFRYRTKAQAQDANIKVDVEPSSNQEVNELQSMEKQELIEMLIRAKSKLGGKIPSPPITPVPATQMPGAFPVKAPKQDHLQYTIPGAKSEPASRSASGATDNSKKSNDSNNWNDNKAAETWNDSGNQQNISWDGQIDQGGNKRASVASTKTVKPDQGQWDLGDNDAAIPVPPDPSAQDGWADTTTTAPVDPKGGW